jgi:hypothetical protein
MPDGSPAMLQQVNGAQAYRSVFCKAAFDDDILAFHKTALPQSV